VAWKGSPDSTGAFWTAGGYPPDETIGPDSRLTALLRKQEAVRALFATDGLVFEVTGFDGFTPFKCNPRVKRVEFPDGEGKGANNTETWAYTVTLEADSVAGLAGSDQPAPDTRVSKFSSEWNMEVLDETRPTYRLTRYLAATGRRLFDETGALLDGKEAWQNARDYLLDAVGLGLNPVRMASSGVLDAATVQAFNYLRSDHIAEAAGACSVTETWVCYDPKGEPPALHERTVTARTSIQDGRVTVAVGGTVQGLEQRDPNTRALTATRYANAQAKWAGHVFPALYATAQAGLVGLAATTLNPLPVSASVGTNDVAGTVTYQYEYDNRPANFTPGALSETVTVTSVHAADVFAQVPVLGRPLGPVLQGTGTVTAKKRTVALEVQMPAATTNVSLAQPDTAPLVAALAPAGPFFVEADEEIWVPRTGRYSRTTTFVYE
jgi:hypothetical protein